jgi:hypothetical protein
MTCRHRARRIFPGQQLEEDDASAAAKTRWPMFPRWEYTPDTTAKLEAQNIKVDIVFLIVRSRVRVRAPPLTAGF